MTKGSRRSFGPVLLERATMHDVAAAAGVSLKTVSRVINLEPGVSDATVTRVHNAIAQLRYRRNDLARNLRKGISLSSVGMVTESLADPLHSAAAQSVEEVTLRNGRELLMAGAGRDPERERKLIADLLRQGVEGLMIAPSGDDYAFLEPDIRLGIRVVFLYREPETIEADVVSSDNTGASLRAIEHLMSYGHERIAFIGDPNPGGVSAGRYEAYRHALATRGLPFDEDLVRRIPRAAEAAEAAVRMLRARPRPPTAVLTENSTLCVGALAAIRKLPIRPAVVGFDDFEAAGLLEVSVVTCDPVEIGRVACELLFARLAGDARPPQRIVISSKLLARGSGEVVATKD